MAEPFHQILVRPENIPASIYPHYPGEVLIDLHWHQELELIASLDSQIKISVGSKHYILKENDVALINRAEIHRGVPLSDHTNTGLSINFSPDFIKQYCKYDYTYFSFSGKPEIRREIAGFMKQIFDIYDQEENDPYDPLKINGLLCQIAYLLLSECQVIAPQPKSESTVKYQQRYLDIMAYIQEHYNESLTLESVATYAHLSKEHLSREFKKYVGEGFRTHLVNIRLSKAQADLIGTDMSLLDVALKHGFPDLRSYTMAFKESFGQSPKQYRRNYKIQHNQVN